MPRCVRAPLFALMSALFAMCAIGCSSDPASAPDSVENPSAAVAPTFPPANNIEVSDAVPTLEELNEMGIGDQSAECFIATIDPDGTGRVASAELFLEAWAACL